MASISEIREAANAGAGPDFFEGLKLPPTMRAVHLLRSDVDLYAGLPQGEKDPRKTLHVGDVPVPVPGSGDVLIAVMASAINYNTVWSALFEPMPTFRLIDRRSNSVSFRRQHSLEYQVIGSDAAGVVVAAGLAAPNMSFWRSWLVSRRYSLAVHASGGAES